MSSTVLTAHLALLAGDQNLAANHDPSRCNVCGTEKAEAEVSDTKTKTAATDEAANKEFGAEVAEAVKKETEALATEKANLETENASLKEQVSSLTADKTAADAALVIARNEVAAATARAEAAEATLTEQAAAETAAAERAERITSRSELAKAANPAMGEGYYTEQAEAWADMSEDAFTAALGALAAAVKVMPHEFTQSEDAEKANCRYCEGEKAAAVHVAAQQVSGEAEAAAAEKAALTHTGALKGGATPTAPAANRNLGRDFIAARQSVA